MKASIRNLGPFVFAASLIIVSCEKITLIDYSKPLLPDIPSVVTFPPENITTNTADLAGFISYDGGGNILGSGINIYETGISPLPGETPAAPFRETRYSDRTTDDRFGLFLADLKPNTTYHYRAFATNEAGTAYGDMKILVTSYGRVSDREGNQYQTVRIGNQVWMRENLKTTRYNDGSYITGVHDSGEGYNSGKLYSWQAAQGGVCPDGWHLPADSEWQALLIYSGIPPDQVKIFGPLGNNQALDLKDPGSNLWNDPKITNSTGFSAVPAGVYSSKGEDNELQAAFWTSTPYIYFGFPRGPAKIIRGSSPEGDQGFSVRCIMD